MSTERAKSVLFMLPAFIQVTSLMTVVVLSKALRADDSVEGSTWTDFQTVHGSVVERTSRGATDVEKRGRISDSNLRKVYRQWQR